MSDNIGSRIKKLRKEKQISVEELAKKIGKSRATVYRYENNEIENLPYTILVPIADALDTTPAIIMGYDETINKDINSNTTKSIVDDTLDCSHNLSLIIKWNHEFDEIRFSDDEIAKLIEYAKFLISRRKEDE